MTRDEAIAKIGGNRARADEIVGAITSLGLLTLDGTNKPNEALRSALSIRGVDSDKVFGAMAAAGLRVVPA